MEGPIESAKHGEQKTLLVARSADERGMKVVERYEVKTRNADTLRYVEKKLEDKGIMRRDKHPVDGKGGVKKPPPKQGRGGKFTWEGPGGDDDDMEMMPGAIDENDPNYVDDEEEENDGGVGERAVKVGEGRAGVAELYVDPRLKVD